MTRPLVLVVVIGALAACSHHGTSTSALPAAQTASIPTAKSVSPASIAAPTMAAMKYSAAVMYARTPRSAIAPLGWTQLPGAGVYAAASPDDSLWVLSTLGGPDHPIYHYANGVWTNIPGAATRLAAAPDGTLWAVNSAGGIYHWDGSAWSTIAGGASDITVASDGSVFVISSVPGGTYGRGIWHFANGGWTQMPGAGIQIASSWDTGSYGGGITPGGFYVINGLQSIYYYNPSLGFQQLPGAAVQLAPTKTGGVFALGVPGGQNGNPIYYDDLGAGTWTQQPGAGVAIATDSAHVFVIGAAGGIYYAPVTTTGTPTGTFPLSWMSIGPRFAGASGEIQAYATAGSTVYIGGGGGAENNYSSAGIFKSVDGGGTFAAANTGLADRSVNVLWANADGSVVLCGTSTGGIYRSTNAAGSWTRVNAALSITAIAIVGSTLYAATAGGLLQSNDVGATWSNAYTTTSPVTALAVAGSMMYIGLQSGSILQNGGSGLVFHEVFHTSNPVFALTIDGSSPQIVYAAVAFDALYQTKDGGATWTKPGTAAVNANPQALTMSATTPHVVYVGNHNQVFTSTDQGATWHAVANIGFDVRSVYSTATGSSESLVVGSDQGLFQTTDAGQTWRNLSGGLSTFLVTGVGVSGSTVVASAQDGTSMTSQDGGNTWTFPGLFPGAGGGEGGPAIVNPGNSKFCYFYGAFGYVSSTDGCRTTKSSSTLPAQKNAVAGEYGPNAIAVDPQSPTTVFVATQSGVYRSGDGGVTFSNAGWPFSAARMVEFDPSNDRTVFVVTEPSIYTFGTLNITHDGGSTWATSNLPSAGYGAANSLLFAIDPVDSNTVVAAIANFNATGGLVAASYQVYRSTNGGSTFSAVGTVPAAGLGLSQFSGTYACGMSFNPQSAAPFLALACASGVFVSTDNGSSWNNVTGDATGMGFGAVAWNNGSLYVGSWGQGVLKSSTQLQSTSRITAGQTRR